MAFPPIEPSDPFDLAGSLGIQDSFQASQTPSVFGYGTRQSRLTNNRAATDARHVIHWLVPEGPIVQMYINPQSITTPYTKAINSVRTKGGFVLQYWGEELTPLSIQGTTGTAGIEGINVLYDIYRNEQLAFDPYALYLESQVNQEVLVGNVLNDGILTAGTDYISALINGPQALIPSANRNPPSLAALAFSVEMYYSGEVYRGYFKEFQITERAENLGMFDYTISFVATQKRGFRQNFLAWHRSATSGPSNSDPIHGRPYSFGSLINPNPGIPPNNT
jgi:hypothetical protein